MVAEHDLQLVRMVSQGMEEGYDHNQGYMSKGQGSS